MTENIECIHSYTHFHKFKDGLKKGLPIGLGYISVSLTFGMMSVSGGISPLMAIFISLTNLTSARQFAGIQLILKRSQILHAKI